MRSISKSRMSDQLASILLLVFVVAGCKQLESLGGPTVLKSPDGKFQLTVPAGWKENAALNDKAEIKAANLREEGYVIVLTDSKKDLDEGFTLDDFTKLTSESFSSHLVAAKSTTAEPITINGNSGRTYQLEGVAGDIKVSYRIATVETADHFHQVITWTLQSHKARNQATLQKIIDSFRPT